MKDNKFTKRMSDKGKLTWQYTTMTAITFVIIFAVVMGILFICSYSAEAMTPDNMNVSLIEQKGTPTAQTMLMNINTSKEPENATQGNTEGNMPEYINLGEFRLTAYYILEEFEWNIVNNLQHKFYNSTHNGKIQINLLLPIM